MGSAVRLSTGHGLAATSAPYDSVPDLGSAVRLSTGHGLAATSRRAICPPASFSCFPSLVPPYASSVPHSNRQKLCPTLAQYRTLTDKSCALRWLSTAPPIPRFPCAHFRTGPYLFFAICQVSTGLVRRQIAASHPAISSRRLSASA
eukprot:779543-Rhodomonas_salina.1